MDVARGLDWFHGALLDVTIHTPNEVILDDNIVSVHLYQSSFQGWIVDDVTTDPIVPTTLNAKSKLAKRLKSNSSRICAELFVPLRKNTDNVFAVADAEKLRGISLDPRELLPARINVSAEEKIGKSADVAILVPLRAYNPLSMLLDWNSVFVRSSSTNNLYWARVIGS